MRSSSSDLWVISFAVTAKDVIAPEESVIGVMVWSTEKRVPSFFWLMKIPTNGSPPRIFRQSSA